VVLQTRATYALEQGERDEIVDRVNDLALGTPAPQYRISVCSRQSLPRWRF
jgi:hypothetical protein